MRSSAQRLAQSTPRPKADRPAINPRDRMVDRARDFVDEPDAQRFRRIKEATLTHRVDDPRGGTTDRIGEARRESREIRFVLRRPRRDIVGAAGERGRWVTPLKAGVR